MERLEEIKSIGWFHLLILKAIISEPTRSMSTKQIADRLESYFKFYGIPFARGSRRVFFMQKVGLLVRLGLLEVTKGSINIYSLKPEYASEVMMLVAGYFGLVDKAKSLERD